LLNGEPTNCCDTNCRFRPNGSSCTDQLFCNGGERCNAGVCGSSEGTPCVRNCELCDEADNRCDAAACPIDRVPRQPTREMLIGEIFDGDGDRYDTSAGGIVRGTLDLDANADLHFTAADFPRLPRCAADAVLVGGICIDKYEASVFPNPPGSSLPGNQFGLLEADYPCRDDGADCPRQIWAYSLSDRRPSAFITWFQAQRACASVGKRLLTNAEWQMAVVGTPDSDDNDDGATTCNTGEASNDPVFTGSRSACVSKWGHYDMVGNLWEFVAEWMPTSSACLNWGNVSDDVMCLAGVNTTETSPGVVIRGGSFGFGSRSGPLAIQATVRPSLSSKFIGFRCARRPS
jgi:hypothetical protein